VEFHVFFEFFFEIFKKFQILFFQYIKLQVEVNNVLIIFDNCAFKCQNSRKTRILDSTACIICIYVWAVGDQGEQMANHLGQEQPVWAEGGQGEQRRVTQLPSLLIMLIC
jgi:hypothetical protein